MAIRLLIIEDDVILANTLKTILEPEGFEILLAESGEDGIEQARQWNPEVILLDLMMPGMDGWQVCRAIRQFSTTPILVQSAVINPEMVAQALDEGANDYLVKPTPTGVLAARLKRLARLHRASTAQNDSGKAAG